MTDSPSSWGGRYFSVWLVWVVRKPIPVLLVIALVTLLSGLYASKHLGVNTDPVDMLDESLPFRSSYDRYRDEFPDQVRTVLVIIEGSTPEEAYAAAKEVREGMRAKGQLFPSIDWPQGDEYLQRHGLLFRDIDALNRLGNRLSAAQPLLARLNQNPSLPGLLNLMADAREHAAALGADFTELDDAVARSIYGTLNGRHTPLSWQGLLGNRRENGGIYRETLIVRPQLDYGKVRAGRNALEALREIRTQLGLNKGPVRMWITGSVALADEELQSVLTGAKKAGLMSLMFVALIMWLGLRSMKKVLIALIALLVGLLITAGLAAVVVGRVNLVSVAFTVLYVGLGVNYAIHCLLRHSELCVSGMSANMAIIAAGTGLRSALILSAMTTAIGFAAFIPTEFKGVAELGLIAACAMLVTLIVSYTLLPALMALFTVRYKVGAERVPPPPKSGGLLDWPLRFSHQLRWGALVLGVLACVAASQVVFDSDPLNLRDPQAESVITLRRLLSERDTGHRNLQALVDTEEDARRISAELRELPSVGRVLNLFDFLPQEQDDKLLLLDDVNWLLGPELLNADYAPQDRSVVEHLAAIDRLLALLGEPEVHTEVALKNALELLKARYQEREDVVVFNQMGNVLMGLLPVTMERLAAALSVQDVIAVESMPDQLLHRWLSRQGTYLIQIFPETDASEVEQLQDFVTEVQSIDPTVTGAPVIQLVSGEAISDAFQKAILWALLGISLILLVLIRNIAAALKILTPLLLGGVITVALMVFLDIPFNFANVVALPLLLGVGVDNGIHLVYRHRNGELPGGNVLRTATARGIVFGALTTAFSFGNLAFSPHTGTASMGIVLALGLSLVVLTTLVVLPALLNTKKNA